METKINIIAYLLPQFHSIPENDLWWGKDFTEWTNVKKAKPLFKGHNQPIRPGDLGYYNLLDGDIRNKQAILARESGISAFCYYHYWFGHGKKLLEKPVERLLYTKEPDFPFCLCWANESWEGVWHGNPKKTLIEQKYPGKEDIKLHLNYLHPILKDSRYLNYGGKPILEILNPHLIPKTFSYIKDFRDTAKSLGLDLYLIAGYNHPVNYPYKKMGFDNAVSNSFNVTIGELSTKKIAFQKWIQNMKVRLNINKPLIYDYEKFCNTLFKNNEKYSFPIVVPNWDNTPRMEKSGFLFTRVSEELFRSQLLGAIRIARKNKSAMTFLYIKSWNEWAEGNYLEPNVNSKPDFLKILKSILRNDG